ncbi:RNA polymerase, sigma-24 subunit, ECF subfamily [Ktedonobacter racemifer DSM 44963]|uniref:RNA polymerase, sigma-24 subunit, ECF subfamily n=1 Tax=Ktedonobacter racemifer DSM 44963 TaxID=485913 RepID=D6U3V4_KTERA|nr:sigma factor [Ktedonobacter racemifer]EFH81192.1 RNA polymerase, sigma-24 subunit, ECF subfamily [Ktedonobacter racemifer DSM 44963]
MENHDWLAQAFEESHPHLRAVAYRLLGSLSEADDAIQEAWLRLSRSDMSEVSNLGGWLTTVGARISLNMLRGDLATEGLQILAVTMTDRLNTRLSFDRMPRPKLLVSRRALCVFGNASARRVAHSPPRT